MPQLDFSTFSSQLFWLALSFLILYVLMARLLAPRIGDALDKREQKRSSDLSQAAHMKDDAERLKAVYETALAEARTKSQAMTAEVLQQSKQDAASAQSRLDAELAEGLALAERATQNAVAQAQSSIGNAASALASAIVEKLSGLHPSDSELQAAIASTDTGKGR